MDIQSKHLTVAVIIGLLLVIGGAANSIGITAAAPYQYLWLEAESGQENQGQWFIMADKTASGGKYIVSKAPKAKPDPLPDGRIRYHFNLAKAGKYKIFIRYMAPGKGTSYYFAVNSEVIKTRTEHDSIASWAWSFINNDNPGKPLIFDLKAGPNLLIISHREPKYKIDKFLVTDDLGLTPEKVARLK